MKIIVRASFLFAAILACCLSASAQTKVTVQVQSKDNGLPVELIYINVYEGNPEKKAGTAISDESGKTVVAIQSFPAVIEAVGVGYEMERVTLRDAPSQDVVVKVSKTFSSLNEVVVTGVLNPIKPLDAFSNYKVITAATMQSMGAVTVQDAISYQLNTVTNNDGILGGQIRMQGMGGNKVKILMDGVPINGREDGNIDLGQFNTYNLERIEIVQGPMSIMYGTDALGGVINLISKNTKKDLALNGEVYYESIGKYNFNATVTKSIGKHQFSLGGGRNFFYGYGKLITDSAAYGPHRTSAFKPKEQYLGNLNYSFNHSERFNLRFASDFVKEKITNLGIADINSERAFAFDDYYRVTRSVNRLSANGRFKNGAKYQLINGYSLYHRIKNSYNKNLVNLKETLLTTDGLQDTATYHEVSLRGLYENNVLEKLEYGAGYDVNLQQGKSHKLPADKGKIQDYAAFMNISYPFFNDKLKLQAAARASYNSKYQAPVVPSFNLLYRPAKNVSIRGSYAKGFRSPSLKELSLDFVDNNHKIFGNPNLKAEKGDHFQGSVSWMVFEKGANYGQVLVTGFYNNLTNQIALAARYPGTANSDSAQYFDYTNILKMRNFIANLEFEGQYSNFHYKLGYAYTYTFRQEYQYDAFDAQELTTTLQYYWRKSKLNFSLFNRLNGARPFLSSNIDGTSTYTGRQPVYNMMDFSVSRKFWKQNLQITMGIKNVFDVVGFSAGTVVTSAHGGDASVSFMPRSFFTSLRLNID